MLYNDFGKCEVCEGKLKPTGYFKEKEYDVGGKLTGRVKNSLNSLECPKCFKKFAVDDTFDGEWYTPKS